MMEALVCHPLGMRVAKFLVLRLLTRVFRYCQSPNAAVAESPRTRGMDRTTLKLPTSQTNALTRSKPVASLVPGRRS